MARPVSPSRVGDERGPHRVQVDVLDQPRRTGWLHRHHMGAAHEHRTDPLPPLVDPVREQRVHRSHPPVHRQLASDDSDVDMTAHHREREHPPVGARDRLAQQRQIRAPLDRRLDEPVLRREPRDQVIDGPRQHRRPPRDMPAVYAGPPTFNRRANVSPFHTSLHAVRRPDKATSMPYLPCRPSPRLDVRPAGYVISRPRCGQRCASRAAIQSH